MYVQVHARVRRDAFPYACTNNPDGCMHFRHPDVYAYFIFTEALLHCCSNTNTEHENALAHYCSR